MGALLVGGGAIGGVGAGCDAGGGDVPEVECASARQFLTERGGWQVIEQNCIGCHNSSGLGKDTSFVLKSSVEAGFLEHNLAVLKEVATLERDGQPQLILKPSGGTPHEGGVLVQPGSDEYKTLLGLAVRLRNEEQCDTDNSGFYAGVELHDSQYTLRKASLMVAGRLPSAEENARVKEGGVAALDAVLDEMMTEKKFVAWVGSVYSDLFLTDFYVNNGADQVEGAYADPTWFENGDHKALLNQYGLQSVNELETYTDLGIARGAVGMIQYVVQNDLPFTEVVTADYAVFTPLSARSYGVTDITFQDESDPLEFQPGRIEGFPHAGVLTSDLLWRRHPTTPTNRNRARARKVLRWFLGTDIMRLAKEPIDQTASDLLNPTSDDAQCTVCHASLDPMAGLLAAIDEDGQWADNPDWFSEMFAPGFGGEKIAAADLGQGAQWLAERLVKDDRFTLGAVYNIYTGMTGREPLAAPDDYANPNYEERFAAFLAQANTFRAIADKFERSNYNIKVVVKELVLSPYFRAKNATAIDAKKAVALGGVGLARLLPPELLHNKIEAVFGMTWTTNRENERPQLIPNYRRQGNLGRVQLFYGGVDSNQNITRAVDPNGIIAAVADRMATEMACRGVSYDFYRSADERMLFPMVDVGGTPTDVMSLEPENAPNGITIEPAVAGIKLAIVNLHQHILGEQLTVSSPEVEHSYQLFLETWREGKAGIIADDDSVSTFLPFACQVRNDFYSGADFAEEDRLEEDDSYVIRSWMAVVTYLTSDHKFLYE